MKKNFTSEQNQVLKYDDSLLVLALAGSGKTTTIISKAEDYLAIKKDKKWTAILTYNSKAASDISSKISSDNLFIGTFHKFVINEILPFGKHIFSNTEKMWDSQNLVFYFNDQIKISSLKEGIDLISSSYSVYSYEKNLEKKGFDFLFDLAVYIINKSLSCRLYLQSKYDWIFNDESQDNNKSQFLLLEEIYKLNIKLLLIGDINQSIYGWRGAKPEELIQFVKNKNIKFLELNKNFRSDQSIQNFSNIFARETPRKELLRFSKKKVQFIEEKKFNIFLNLVKEKNIEMVFLNHSIKNQNIYPNFITLIKNPEFLYSSNLNIPINENLIFELIKFLTRDDYNLFDLIQALPEFNSKKFSEKEVVDFLLELNKNKNNKNYFTELFLRFNYYFNFDFTLQNAELIFDNICKEEVINWANQDKYSLKAMTIYASKGLEFKNVTIFLKDYIDWKETIRNWELFYVASTRAKTNLFIVGDSKFWKSYFSRISQLNEIPLDDIIYFPII